MGTFKVRTPVPDYSGMVGGVAFSDGEATVEGILTFADGVPVLDESTDPVEFHHMVKAGYIIEPVAVAKKAVASSKETTA